MYKNNNYKLLITAFSGVLAVAIGAFGAHGLKPHLTPYQLDIFNTGNEYHFYHTLAMGLVVLLIQKGNSTASGLAFYCFLAGTVFFSGSLYLLATRDILGISGWSWLGPVTPIGGVLFIVGWICLGLHAIKTGKQ